MFRLTMFVEDKQLAEVLKGVSGKVLNLETQFVVNAEASSTGRVQAKAADTVTLIRNEMVKRQMRTFKAQDFKQLIGSIGLTPTSYSYHLINLTKSGFVRKSGEGMQTIYTVKT